MSETSIEQIQAKFARLWMPLATLCTVAGGVASFIYTYSHQKPFYVVAVALATAVVIIVGIRRPRFVAVINRLIFGLQMPGFDPPKVFKDLRAYEPHEDLPERQADADVIWQKIRSESFFILEGESGCGKSSVINAKMIPFAEPDFTFVISRPSLNPLERLRKELTEAKDNRPLIFCLDQFEELFYEKQDTERAHFLKELYDSLSPNQGRLKLVFVIRSDYRDLLDKACRECDPTGSVLSLANDYFLRPFREHQAVAAVMQMLAPLHEEAPLLKQQHSEFAAGFAKELLRPPRDSRLSRHDEFSVLPAELQAIGGTLEALGHENFSITHFHALGGKSGLLRLFTDRAKTYVLHKTGVPPERSLLVLRKLISGNRRHSKSAREIAREVSLKNEDALKVLNAFKDQRLVRDIRNDAIEDDLDSLFELTHESLVFILSEAPESVLQKARDAEERLRFWVDRTRHLPSKGEPKLLVILGTMARALRQPVPLSETLKLWKYAPPGVAKKMLRRSATAFCTKLAILIALALGIAIAILENAPLPQRVTVDPNLLLSSDTVRLFYENEEFVRAKKEAERLAATGSPKEQTYPVDFFLDHRKYWDKYMLVRGTYEIVKSWGGWEYYGKRYTESVPQRILYYDKETSASNFSVRFLDSLVRDALYEGAVDFGSQALVLTFTGSSTGSVSDAMLEFFPEIVLIDCPDRSTWGNKLWELNQPDEQGRSRSSIIIQCDSDMVRLIRACAVHEILTNQNLNREPPRKYEDLTPGRELIIGDIMSKYHVLNKDIADTFFITECYFRKIADTFAKGVSDLNSRLQTTNDQQITKPDPN